MFILPFKLITNLTVNVILVDVSNSHSSEQAIKDAEEEFGPVFLLVNSAGCSVAGKFEDIPAEDIKVITFSPP